MSSEPKDKGRGRARPEWQDPRIPERNRQQHRAFFLPHASVPDALARGQHSSDEALELDGEWDFKLAGSPRQVPSEFWLSEKNWSSIPVPSNWHFHGFGQIIYTNIRYPFPIDRFPELPKAVNETGLYRRLFKTPPRWTSGRRLILRFDGVDSAFYVWINGHLVGYSTNSAGPAEFDITHCVHVGQEHENTIAVMVIRWSAGSFLEDQDTWRLGGIFRPVRIITIPPVAIEDFFVKTTLSESTDAALSAKLDLSVHLRDWEGLDTTASFCLDVSLLDPQAESTEALWKAQAVVTSTEFMTGRLTKHFEQQIYGFEPWSCEDPRLYTLVIELRDPSGDLAQCLAKKIGFRTVQIKNAQLLLNGDPLAIRGVNRSEIDPDTGRQFSISQMVRDICLIKQHNFNAVRTSHHPPHPLWSELCDEYGLYQCVDANIECHEFWQWRRIELANDARLQAQFMDRTVAMVERDKNSPSVIMWSLGNEAGWGRALQRNLKWIKQRDSSRPVQYEGRSPYTHTGRTNADFISNMYVSPDDMIRLSQGDPKRPVILCEFSHAMGNSNGNLYKYTDAFDDDENHPRIQGGFIWEFADQGVRQTSTQGQSYFAYGGDFGDSPNDGSFCLDGVFSADRKSSPSAEEIKFRFQRVIFRNGQWSANHDHYELEIENRYHATCLSKFTLEWQAKDAWGFCVASGTMDLPKIAPREACEIRLPLLKSDLPVHESAWLALSIRTRVSSLWAEAWHEVAKAQVCLAPENDAPRMTNSLWTAVTRFPKKTAWQVKEKAGQVTIRFGDTAASISATTGLLATLHHCHEPIFQRPAAINLFRVPIDNDGSWGTAFAGSPIFPSGLNDMFVSLWNRYGLETVAPRDVQLTLSKSKQKVGRLSCNYPVVQARGRLCSEAGLSFGFEVNHDFLPGGLIRISVHIQNPHPIEMLPSLGRVGLQFFLPRDFQNFSWLGRGPQHSYPDRKDAQFVGLYRNRVPDNNWSFAKPQENGNKSEVRWLSLSNRLQSNLLVHHLDEFLNASVHNYDLHELARTSHAYLVKDVPRVTLNIDHKMLGVGGDESWAPRIHPEFLLNAKSYSFGFVLAPLKGTEEDIRAWIKSLRDESGG